MSITVCLCPSNTLYYLEGGGHFWVYLNWALGLKSLGCRVIWLDCSPVRWGLDDCVKRLRVLKERLGRFGLGDALAFHPTDGKPYGEVFHGECLGLEDAVEAELLLNQKYDLSEKVVRRFRRSCLLDIDPGLLQLWISQGNITPARHDIYFTIGETVGQPDALFPDCGLRWHYTPPCVALDRWPVTPAPSDSAFTTVSHWEGDEWIDFRGRTYPNDKKQGFLPYVDLPKLTDQPLELALCMNESSPQWSELGQRGWRTRHSWEVSSRPELYGDYIRNSRGEFSCVKPSCLLLQNAWISDRTLCYLASGKPAVVEHTGPSRFLPDADGLFRFQHPNEAVRALEAVAADYDRQCARARSVAEEFFDARKVTGRLLERALA